MTLTEILNVMHEFRKEWKDLNAQIEELTNQVKELQDIKEQNLELAQENDSIKTELFQL